MGGRGVKELTVYYYEHRMLLQHAIFADYYKPRKYYLDQHGQAMSELWW